MVYFLGRDVDVFITTESIRADDAVGVSGTSGSKLLDNQTGSAIEASLGAYMFAPSMVSAAVVSGGRVKDLTGVDLSIGVSDEDIGPYFGQVTTQKIELRKEHTVSLTRKKSNISWDIMFNGPCATGMYDLTNANVRDAAWMGPRWGLVNATGTLTTSRFALSNGNFNPKYAPGLSGGTTDSIYGYRVHVRLKNAKEVYTLRNTTITGHTVSINADGTQEETLELYTTITPRLATGSHSFITTQTVDTEL